MLFINSTYMATSKSNSKIVVLDCNYKVQL